jgi:hypothetical protein
MIISKEWPQLQAVVKYRTQFGDNAGLVKYRTQFGDNAGLVKKEMHTYVKSDMMAPKLTRKSFPLSGWLSSSESACP